MGNSFIVLIDLRINSTWFAERNVFVVFSSLRINDSDWCYCVCCLKVVTNMIRILFDCLGKVYKALLQALRRLIWRTTTSMEERFKQLDELPKRTECPKCSKKRFYFCYDCHVYMTDVLSIVPYVEVSGWSSLFQFCSCLVAFPNCHHQTSGRTERQVYGDPLQADSARRDCDVWQRRHRHTTLQRRTQHCTSLPRSRCFVNWGVYEEERTHSTTSLLGRNMVSSLISYYLHCL